jgi:peptidyl-prolyl cis-trans isomerase D
MAIIGKIRSKSGLLVGFIAVALLLFVLSDLLSNKGGAPAPTDRIAGEVFGEEISYMEYEKEYEIAEGNKKQEILNQRANQIRQQVMFQMMASGKKMTQQEMEQQVQMEMEKARMEITLTDAEKDQLREQVWGQLINRRLFDRAYNALGVNVSPGELNDLLFGENIQDYVKSAEMFKNAQGQFSVDSVKRLRQRVEASAEGKSWWVNAFEIPLKDQRKFTKYFNLISKGMYVTTAEVKYDHIATNRKYKIKFVNKSFEQIPDSTIKVTDEEIKTYYEKHKHRKKFEQYGSRKYAYVEFPMVIGQADIDFAKAEADKVYEKFKASKDDSLFVMTYSESKMFNEMFDQPGKYPADVDSLIQKADSGTIVGPYMDGNFWKMVKVRESKFEEQAKVRHILIAYSGAMRADGVTRTKDQAKALADSIVNALRKKGDWGVMLNKYNDDKASTANGGVYEWFNKEMGFTQKFKDFAFQGKKGEVKSVETEFGYHVMEVLGQRNQKVIKSALVDLKITPMKETEMAVREKAVEFLSKISDATKFQQVAQDMKLVVKSNEIAYNQQDIDQRMPTPAGRIFASNLMRLNENDLSQPFLFNSSYVVVKLEAIKNPGLPEFEDVKEIMKFEVIREKKAEMEAAKMKGAKSLEELASRLKLEVKTADITFSMANIPGTTGAEYGVIGSICSMQKPGDMSVPLKGKNGVYVVVLQGITEAPELKDMTPVRANMTSAIRSRAQNDVYMAMRTLAKIVDKRFEF